jgi:glycosyltransferase involved in cell wall biosynthesis
MHTPIVSVLMTAYNREKFIAEAIESVMASSFLNFELIIVDDCSEDNTVSIAKNFAEKDNRISLYVNNKNLGDYPNRNKAASYAKGKYIKYLDSDDTMTPNCLERMVIEMETHPECAFGISSRSLTHSIVHQPEDAYRVHFFERGILDLGPSFTIIRNEIFKLENGFWELRCVSDFEFWMRLSLKYPMIEMETGLVTWRQHEQQEILQGNEEYLKHTLRILIEKLNESKLTVEENNKLIAEYKKRTFRYIIKNAFKIGIIKSMYLIHLNSFRIKDLF